MSQEQADERMPPDAGWPLEEPAAWRRIAHDLRSPLGLISGALEELEHDLEASPTPRSPRLLALADRGVSHLNRIAALLTVSAEGAQGQLSAERVAREIGPVLDAALANIARMDPRAALTVSTSIPSGLEVSVDVEHMLIALGEILLVARRAAETSLAVHAFVQDDLVHVTITDDRDPHIASRRLDAGATYGLAVARLLLGLNGAVVREEPGDTGVVHRLIFARR